MPKCLTYYPPPRLHTFPYGTPLNALCENQFSCASAYFRDAVEEEGKFRMERVFGRLVPYLPR